MLTINQRWEGNCIKEVWNSWWNASPSMKIRNLPLILCWNTWLWRNNIIFKNKLIRWPLIISRICHNFNEILEEDQPTSTWIITPKDIDHAHPWAYFDGSTQDRGCGVGLLLHLSDSHLFHICMGLGARTNNYVELISLRHLLYFALNQNCKHLHIFGDSKIVINWFNFTSACHVHSLRNILDDALFLKSQFDQISCIHIYRECNKSTDQL